MAMAYHDVFILRFCMFCCMLLVAYFAVTISPFPSSSKHKNKNEKKLYETATDVVVAVCVILLFYTQ